MKEKKIKGTGLLKEPKEVLEKNKKEREIKKEMEKRKMLNLDKERGD